MGLVLPQFRCLKLLCGQGFRIRQPNGDANRITCQHLPSRSNSRLFVLRLCVVPDNLARCFADPKRSSSSRFAVLGPSFCRRAVVPCALVHISIWRTSIHRPHSLRLGILPDPAKLFYHLCIVAVNSSTTCTLAIPACGSDVAGSQTSCLRLSAKPRIKSGGVGCTSPLSSRLLGVLLQSAAALTVLVSMLKFQELGAFQPWANAPLQIPNSPRLTGDCMTW